MKKAIQLLIAAIFLFSFGCATKTFVKEQTDPLADRLSKLEARTAAAEMKSDQAVKDSADAKAMAQDALNTSKATSDKSEMDAKRAQDAADRAEAAAKKAEMESAKAQKAFELQQKK